jgi:uncharacterized protein YjeT (DUF2065 family)
MRFIFPLFWNKRAKKIQQVKSRERRLATGLIVMLVGAPHHYLIYRR